MHRYLSVTLAVGLLGGIDSALAFELACSPESLKKQAAAERMRAQAERERAASARYEVARLETELRAMKALSLEFPSTDNSERALSARSRVASLPQEISDQRAAAESAALAAEGAESAAEEKEAKWDFTQLDMGVGVGVAFGSDDQVSEASLVEERDGDRVVEVSKTENDQVRAVFEAHRFMFGLDEQCSRGWGPFVSVQTGGGGGGLTSFGLGLMYGWRDLGQKGPGAGWSLGLGYYLDNSVKKLGDGIRAGQPLPSGDQVRFKEESDGGLLLVFSRTF